MGFHLLSLFLASSLTGSSLAQFNIRSDFTGSAAQVDVPDTLNLTALTGRNNVSVLECWQLSQKLAPSTIPGRIGSYSLSFGNAENTSYGVIPPNFSGGLHNAPRKQYVWWISGLVHFVMPNITEGSPSEVLIEGGKHGLIFADDTADVSAFGHDARYPSDEMTISFSVPTPGGITPAHTVLHDGPCIVNEFAGV